MHSRSFLFAFGILSALTTGEAKKPCKPRTPNLDTPVFSATPPTTSSASDTLSLYVTPSSSATPDISTTPSSSAGPISSTTPESSTTPNSSEVSRSLETPSLSEVASSLTTPSSSVIFSTTVISSTADVSSTAASSSAAPSPTNNFGFDDNSESLSPWTNFRTAPGVVTTIDDSVKQSGSYSAKLSYSLQAAEYVMHRFDASKIQAGASYEVSAYYYTTNAGLCTLALLACTSTGTMSVNTLKTFPSLSATNTWFKGSATCTFTQANIDQGNMNLLVGWNCKANGVAWVDTVTVTPY